MCTWRVTQETPNEKHGKGELPKLQPPQTGLLSPWHGSASSMGLKVCLHPVYTHSKATQSLAAEGWGGEGTSPSATSAGRAQWGLGHQGTRLVAPHPTYSQSGGPEQGHCPHSHPSGPQWPWPQRNPCPSAPQPRGWMGSKAAPQAKARMFPNLGQKQQAEGLLIAS